MVEFLLGLIPDLLAWLIWGDDKRAPRPFLIWSLRILSIGGGLVLVVIALQNPQTPPPLIMLWLVTALITFIGDGYLGSKRSASLIFAVAVIVVCLLMAQAV